MTRIVYGVDYYFHKWLKMVKEVWFSDSWALYSIRMIWVFRAEVATRRKGDYSGRGCYACMFRKIWFFVDHIFVCGNVVVFMSGLVHKKAFHVCWRKWQFGVIGSSDGVLATGYLICRLSVMSDSIGVLNLFRVVIETLHVFSSNQYLDMHKC